MITDYVEAHSRFVVFDLRALEKGRIEEIISAVRKCKLKTVFLSKPEQDVEEGAAGRFVGLHEHYVHFRRALLTRVVL